MSYRPIDINTTGNLLIAQINAALAAIVAAAGSGDFSGPASSVAHNFVGFADTSGKLGEDSGKGAASFDAAGAAAAAIVTAEAYTDTQIAGVHSIPSAGTTGQVLTKINNTNYNVDWETPAAAPVGANPSATASDVAVNGSAATFMRSDGAPPVQKGSSSAFGIVKVDNSTIVASGGVITATGFAPAAAAYHPGFQSGRYYSNPFSSSQANSTIAANTLYAMPFYVPSATTFSTIAVQCSVGAGGKFIELGVYSNSNGVPNTKEYDGGSTSIAGTGVIAINSLSLALSAGWHWAVVASDGTPTLRKDSSSGVQNQFIGYDPATITQTLVAISGAWTFSAGALPNSFPTPVYSTSVNNPMIYLKL